MIGDEIKKYIEIVKKAGKEILKYYDRNCGYELKNDNSPVTIADLKSHEILFSEISKISSHSIISEESKKIIQSNTKYFWLIDPLDGTKEFLAKTDEFSINIALINIDTPVFGIIYSPCLNEVCFAKKNKGVFLYKNKNFIKLPINKDNKQISIIKSRRHIAKRDLDFINKNNITKIIYMGSAIKFVEIAKGKATIYPRFVGSSEWDIASGFILLKEMGGTIIDLQTKKEMKFNKMKFKNNSFIALKNHTDFLKFKYE